MIRAFAAALEDDNLLVRRGTLDLLLQSLRLDSLTLVQASVQDRCILMRAAISAVLRRDLSLNRRVYTWLLGPSESSDKQVLHFRTYALELLCDTLRVRLLLQRNNTRSHTVQEEMRIADHERPLSRPYKIFISLLDKWEIGAPLTEVLLYDALIMIKTSLGQRGNNDDDEV